MDPTELDPARGMKVTMLLADHAQVMEGKLNVIGGGWTHTGPQPLPFAIAGIFEVPWHLANRKHQFQLDLIDLDGRPVTCETPQGEEPVTVGGTFEVGREPGLREGAGLPFLWAINSGPLPLGPGSHFEWRLLINGEAHEDWRLAFSTRPEAQSNVA